MKKIFRLVSIIIILTAVSVYAAPENAKNYVTIESFSSRNFQVFQNNKMLSKPNISSKIYSGDTIITEAGCVLTIAVDKTTKFEITGNARFNFDFIAFKTVKNKNNESIKKNIIVKLSEGSVNIDVKILGRGSLINIITPLAVCDVRKGGKYSIGHSDRTIVSSEGQGSIDVREIIGLDKIINVKGRKIEIMPPGETAKRNQRVELVNQDFTLQQVYDNGSEYEYTATFNNISKYAIVNFYVVLQNGKVYYTGKMNKNADANGVVRYSVKVPLPEEIQYYHYYKIALDYFPPERRSLYKGPFVQKKVAVKGNIAKTTTKSGDKVDNIKLKSLESKKIRTEQYVLNDKTVQVVQGVFEFEMPDDKKIDLKTDIAEQTTRPAETMSQIAEKSAEPAVQSLIETAPAQQQILVDAVRPAEKISQTQMLEDTLKSTVSNENKNHEIKNAVTETITENKSIIEAGNKIAAQKNEKQESITKNESKIDVEKILPEKKFEEIIRQPFEKIEPARNTQNEEIELNVETAMFTGPEFSKPQKNVSTAPPEKADRSLAVSEQKSISTDNTSIANNQVFGTAPAQTKIESGETSKSEEKKENSKETKSEEVELKVETVAFSGPVFSKLTNKVSVNAKEQTSASEQNQRTQTSSFPAEPDKPKTLETITRLAPYNNSTVKIKSPQFLWEKVDGAAYYTLFISKLPLSKTNVIYANTVDGTKYRFSEFDAVEGLIDGQDYCWFVIGHNSSGEIITAKKSGDYSVFAVELPAITEEAETISITSSSQNLVDYSISNLKINNKMAESFEKNEVLNKGNLINGEIIITAKLSLKSGLSNIFITKDGSDYEEIIFDKNISEQEIRYSWKPLSDADYRFKIYTIDSSNNKSEAEYFGQLEKLTYKNITDEQMIEQVLEKLCEAYKNGDRDLLIECISTDFLGQNDNYKDYDELKRAIKDVFNTTWTLSCSYDNAKVTINSKTKANATFQFKRKFKFTSIENVRDLQYDAEFDLICSSGDWKIYLDKKNNIFRNFRAGAPLPPF